MIGWVGPAALLGLAWLACVGDATAPLALALVGLAPLVAFARPADADVTPSLVGPAVVGLAAVVASNTAVAAEYVRIGGVPRVLAAVLAIAIVAIAVTWRGGPAWRVAAPLAVGLLLVSVGGIAVTTAIPPWRAWSQVASRPALVFSERSGWVTHGRPVAAATTMVFEEPHRVTAITAGVYRVIERNGTADTMHERRLEPGESLVVRAGDRLAVEAGMRVRFERGKRVPGVAASGVLWADPDARRGLGALGRALGLALTLVGGAMAVVAPIAPPTTRGAAVAVTLPAIAALSAAAGGVYAVYLAPDVVIGATLVAPLHELPVLAIDGYRAASVGAMLGAGVLGLTAASAWAIAVRTRRLASIGATRWPRSGRMVTAVLIAAAAVGALLPLDGWRLLLLALGFLACVTAAPAVASAGARATTIGGVTGALVFIVLALGAGRLGLAVLAAYPALLAAPAAWGATAAVARAES
jgi:hypothetical protein